MFRKNIREMEEYKPPLEGRSLGYLLLDFNERTKQPPRQIRKLLQEYINRGNIQIYPEYGETDKSIANYTDVKIGQAMVTNGSDQGIDIIFRGNVDRGDKVIIPKPSFAMFWQSAHLQGAKIIEPKYIFKNNDCIFPTEEVLDNIDKDTRLVVVCNPNNPTGTVISNENVKKIVKRAKEFDSTVLSDEAYREFNPEITARPLIDSYDNLFITGTFSKLCGAAAQRIGYVLSEEKNIAELKKIRGPYDVNMGAVAILKALKYKDTIKELMTYMKEVMEESKPRTEDFFRDMNIKFYPSGANFILFDPSPLNAGKIYEFLKSYSISDRRGNVKYKGILVRPRSDPPNTIRVTVGTNEDMNYFIEAFSRYLEYKEEK